MVHSFDLLKHFFSQTVGNYPSTTNYSPSSNHWTFATGKVFVKERLTFFLVDSKLKKPHNPKNRMLQTVYPKARFVFRLKCKENAGH